MPAYWVSGFLLNQYSIIRGYQHTSKRARRESAYAKACEKDHRWGWLGMDGEGGNLLLDLTEALLVRVGNGVKVLGIFFNNPLKD